MTESGYDELIDALRNDGENVRLEAKRAHDKVGKSFLETMCAFCNEPDLGGGYIVLGLSERDADEAPYYDITGVADPDISRNEIVTLCRQNFNIQIDPEIGVISHRGKHILVVFIPETLPTTNQFISKTRAQV